MTSEGSITLKNIALHRVLTMLQARPAALSVAEAEGLGQTIFTNPG